MIYIAVLILTIFLAIIYDNKNYVNPIGKKISYYFILIIAIFIAGFRYKIGGDTITLMYEYNSIPSWNYPQDDIHQYLQNSRYQPLWNYLCITCRTFSKDYFVFQIIHAFITNSIIFNFIKKYSKHVFTCIAFYFIVNYLEFNTESTRETLSICTILLGVDFFLAKKWQYFFPLCIIAYGFHISSIFVLIYFFSYFISMKKTNLLICCSFLIILPIIFSKNRDAIFLLNFANDAITDRAEAYSNVTSDNNGNIFFYLFYYLRWYIVPLSALYIINKNQKQKFAFSAFIILMVIVSSLMLYSVIFYRMCNYLIPFYWLLLGESSWCIIDKIKIVKNNSILTFFFLFCLIFPILVLIYYQQFKTGTITRYIPYSSIFN
jgi:hypothetical protein